MQKILIFLVTLLYACPALSFTLSARSMALGESEVLGEWPGYKNPALRYVAPWQRYVIPAPAGIFNWPGTNRPKSYNEVVELVDQMFPVPYHYTISKKGLEEVPYIRVEAWGDSLRLIVAGNDQWTENGRLTFKNQTEFALLAFLFKGIEFRLDFLSLVDACSHHTDADQLMDGQMIRGGESYTGDFTSNNYLYSCFGVGYGRELFGKFYLAARHKLVFGLVNVKAAGEYNVSFEEDLYDEKPDYGLASDLIYAYPFSPRAFPGLGLSLDLGAAWTMGKWIAGIGLSDAASYVSWREERYLVDEELELDSPTAWSSSSNLPKQVTFSLSGPLWKQVSFASEAVIIEDYADVIRLGLETSWRVQPRLGLRWQAKQLLPSAGLGFQIWKSLAIDLAVSKMGKTPFFDSATVFGISFSL